jgi:hypothetical protein
VIDHFLALRQRSSATALTQLGDLHQQEIQQQDNYNTALRAEMWELENQLRMADRDLQEAQVRELLAQQDRMQWQWGPSADGRATSLSTITACTCHGLDCRQNESCTAAA